MARIPMTSGFQLIPEGEYVFRIYDATYDEKFGCIEIYLVNAQGMTLKERFGIMDANGEMNEKALNAFSYFAKTAMNDYSMNDIDPEELINHYIRAEVVHNAGTKVGKNGKIPTFANLGDKSPADGFDTEPCDRAKTLCRADRENFAAKRAARQAAQKAPVKPAPQAAEPAQKLDIDAMFDE